MIECGGVYLPDGETHLTKWMRDNDKWVNGKLTYQYEKLEMAMRYVKNWRVAIDVGGHCGLWSMHLTERFQQVHAYEPVAAHRECFYKNVLPYDWEGEGENRVSAHNEVNNHRVYLEGSALGEKSGSVKIFTNHTSSGDSWVDGEGDIPMRRLDDAMPGASNVDFIKLDCEGYELFALRGAEKILVDCHPCVIVEQKPGRAQKFGLHETGACDYLHGLGAKLKTLKSGDFVFAWD